MRPGSTPTDIHTLRPVSEQSSAEFGRVIYCDAVCLLYRMVFSSQLIRISAKAELSNESGAVAVE